jgi:hypothetical protein
VSTSFCVLLSYASRDSETCQFPSLRCPAKYLKTFETLAENSPERPHFRVAYSAYEIAVITGLIVQGCYDTSILNSITGRV